MRSPARRQSVNVILTQSMPVHPLKSEQKLGERARLLEAREGTAPWRQWGEPTRSDSESIHHAGTDGSNPASSTAESAAMKGSRRDPVAHQCPLVMTR